MILPTGLRGQLTALAVLVIVAILAVEFVIAPLIGRYLSTEEEIFEMRQDIARYRHLLAERSALRELADKLQRNNPLAPITLSGDNPALAAADLQQRLQNAASKNGLRVLSLRIRPTGSGGNMERIAIEARLQGDIASLRDMLFELETGTPYLFLEQLNIRTYAARRRQVGTDNLDVRLELYGMRPSDDDARMPQG